jgi:hypothetical protein
MYLHFEDWTDRAPQQSDIEKRMAHDPRVIKVMTSDIDPRVALGRSALTVLESSGKVFTADESYSYRRRRTYDGDELESDLAKLDLSPVASRSVRSIFRFAYNHGFSQAAMAAQSTRQQWLFKHPFQDISGIDSARRHVLGGKLIHLDIAFPDSFENLSHVVDIDNSAALVGKIEWVHWLNKDHA